MTTTAAVQAEIERFLRSEDPEVLCVTGDWGVGKTFNWQTTLDRLRTAKQVGLGRYSYVSLFGINSLEAFKQSLFENLEFVLPEGEAAFDRIRARGNQLFQQGKKAVGALAAVPKVGDAITKLSSPFLFSSIRNQIICVDDLERRGKDLSVKDVFGLISYLREQRSCKIVLLLNELRLDPDSGAAKEFKDYFEKVIDTKVVFSPTPAEASEIAFRGSDLVSKLTREYSVKLGVKNIRVLKKIERLIQIVVRALPDATDKLQRQIVHSLVIFGWSHFDSGANPPSLQYLREGSLIREARGEKRTPDQERWDAIRVSYDFGYLDEFDLALLNFVANGILDEGEIRTEAAKQEAAIKRGEQSGSFADSFRLLHDSFADNADEAMHAIVKGFEQNIDILTVGQLGQVVEIFDRLGERRLANHVINYAEQNAPPSFWTDDGPFSRHIEDDRITAITAQRRAQTKPAFDFERDLIAAAQSYDAETIASLANQPPDEFLRLFDSKSDGELRKVILSALDFRKIANASPDMRKVVENAEQALRTIGKRSALNAFRVKNYGVSIDPPPAATQLEG
jgi:hypothetical protein